MILAAAASAQQGFPFTSESLKYTIDYTSGLSLGEANFNAPQALPLPGWEFDASVNAAVPGFSILDNLRASATNDLCSTQFMRDLSNGRKKAREKTTFDEKTGKGHRITTLPSDGGETTFTIPSCARDALTFVYYGVGIGTGKSAAHAGSLFRRDLYGEDGICGRAEPHVEGEIVRPDQLVISVKGPKSDFSFEVFYARDAARTPLQIRIPRRRGYSPPNWFNEARG